MKSKHTLGSDSNMRCSICTETFEGHPNEAAPFPGRCCHRCHSVFVIPARLMRAAAAKRRAEGVRQLVGEHAAKL